MRNLLIVLLVSTAISAQTPTKPAPDQGPPPRNLTQRPDGHFSANEDPTNPEKFEVHVVQPGDTLSAIAGAVLKNPRLWPQLWEQNEHIVNPHWIYPNDKILIRPVTLITEAVPPEPPPVTPPPAPAPVVEAAPPPPPPRPTPLPPPQAPAPPVDVFQLSPAKPVSEVKLEDLYCSGFVQKAAVPNDLKVISKFDQVGVLSTEGDYVYVSQGSEDGVAVGNTYQVIRPSTLMTNPTGRTRAERDLGMHYLDVAQIRVVIAQPDFSLARIIHNCADAVDVGDIMLPFRPIVLPPRPRPRPFSPFMTTTGEVKGAIVSTKGALLNFGSAYKSTGIIPGVRGGRLGAVERGIAPEGTIVYLDIGQENGVNPGDLFIVYRALDVDGRLYQVPLEVEKIKEVRTAIGEVLVLKTGERASTALVTYATDALSLGDAVERR
jgi:hypothetical protein